MVNLQKWCEDLLKYWTNKDIDNILKLFDENVIYYETPRQKVTGLEDIRKMWSEIKNQGTSNITMKILCSQNNKCIANYVLNSDISYDMIYEIELNEENKCVHFVQWYMEF